MAKVRQTEYGRYRGSNNDRARYENMDTDAIGACHRNRVEARWNILCLLG